MRITKRIEEYIYQQVEKKAYDSPEIKALKQASDIEEQHYQAALEKIRQTAKTAYIQLLTDMNVSNAEMHTFTYSTGFRGTTILPATEAYHEARKKLRDKIKETVDEILVTMEMGGDKDTLNQLLDAVNFD